MCVASLMAAAVGFGVHAVFVMISIMFVRIAIITMNVLVLCIRKIQQPQITELITFIRRQIVFWMSYNITTKITLSG